jgi:hypothetical protein
MAKKAFDPDAFLRGESAKIKEDFDPEAFLREGLPKQEETPTSGSEQSTKPQVGPSLPVDGRSDTRTTTATNPAEGAAERLRAAIEQKARENAGPALAFGAARGASLGAVDRLAGLGTLIGEHLAATDQNPARPGAYTEGRREYLEPEDKARKASPGSYMLGGVAGGVPLAVAAPQSLLGRLAVSGGMGAAAGALNTREDDAKKMLANAGVGAALGAATEGTVGTVARKVIRNAPEREMKRTVAGIMESEAGRNAAGTGRELARNGKNVKAVLEDNPDARIVMRGEAEKALPVTEKKLAEAYAGQPERYAVIDQTLKPMTVTQILGKIVQAEKDKSIPLKQLELVKDGLKSLRDSIRKTMAPRWGGSESWDGKRLEVSTQQLREWVTSVQGAASPAFRGLHPSETTEAKAVLAKLANNILEERLDAAAAKGGRDVADVVNKIREADKKVSAWKTIQGALEERGLRETAQGMGISTRMAKAGEDAEMAAAAGLAAEGHIKPAMAIAGKSLLSRTVRGAAHGINDRVLAPLQQAAARGEALDTLKQMALDPSATLASISRAAAEFGFPQSIARALFERSQKRKPIVVPQIPRTIQGAQPAPQTPTTEPAWPRDYATSTRTQ